MSKESSEQAANLLKEFIDHATHYLGLAREFWGGDDYFAKLMYPEVEWLQDHGDKVVAALDLHGRDSSIVSDILQSDNLLTSRPRPVWEAWDVDGATLYNMMIGLRVDRSPRGAERADAKQTETTMS